MKHPCFQKHNRACDLSDDDHNSNKIKNIGVLPLPGTSYHALLIKYDNDEKD